MDAMKIMGELSNASKHSAKPAVRRSALLPRKRRPWATYIRPMLGNGTVKNRFRVAHENLKALVELLRPALQRNERMGALRNGAIPVEYQLAITLPWSPAHRYSRAWVGM